MDHCTQQKIVYLANHDRSHCHLVESKNFSASGFCFKASKAYPKDTFLLAHHDADFLQELKDNRARIIKTGNYFLARVIWSRFCSSPNEPTHEMGCAYVGLTHGTSKTMELFTRLVNLDAWEQING